MFFGQYILKYTVIDLFFCISDNGHKYKVIIYYQQSSTAIAITAIALIYRFQCIGGIICIFKNTQLNDVCRLGRRPF